MIRGRLVQIDRNAPALNAARQSEDRRSHGFDRHAHASETPHRCDRHWHRSNCSRRSGEVSITIRVIPRSPRPLEEQRATAAAVFFGLLGSQAPQPSAGRGTPAEDPQPRTVSVSVMPSLPQAALLRTAGRSFPWSGAKSPQTRPRVSPPAPWQLHQRRKARCVCRGISRAPDRVNRFRP